MVLCPPSLRLKRGSPKLTAPSLPLILSRSEGAKMSRRPLVIDWSADFDHLDPRCSFSLSTAPALAWALSASPTCLLSGPASTRCLGFRSNSCPFEPSLCGLRSPLPGNEISGAEKNAPIRRPNHGSAVRSHNKPANSGPFSSVPSTQSLSNRSLASDSPRQFCDQMSPISSNNIVQKGLAFGRHWSGTVR